MNTAIKWLNKLTGGESQPPETKPFRGYITGRRIESGNAELQDAAFILEIGSSILLTVADGAGGQSHGREAAERAIQNITYQARQLSLRDPAECRRALGLVDQSVAETGGECTGVLVYASEGQLTGASVGDSEAWLVQDDRFLRLTSYQHRRPFLGSGVAIPVPFGPVPFEGTLLVATDGLVKYVSPESIIQILKEHDLPEAAKRLVELVRDGSGNLPDDATVLLARLA
jgi:PPM family protein phosphatase